MKTSLDSVLVRAGVFQRVKQRDKGEVGTVFFAGGSISWIVDDLKLFQIKKMIFRLNLKKFYLLRGYI